MRQQYGIRHPHPYEQLETDCSRAILCSLGEGGEDVGGFDRAAGTSRIVGLAYPDLVPLVVASRRISTGGRATGGDRRFVFGLGADWLAAIY